MYDIDPLRALLAGAYRDSAFAADEWHGLVFALLWQAVQPLAFDQTRIVGLKPKTGEA